MPRAEVRWEDLPLAVRNRIHDSRKAERAKAAPRIPGTRRWMCCACGEVLYSWESTERHCDEQGHHRVELLDDGIPSR